VKLTEKDKNAILKAALTAKDLDSFKDWVVSLVIVIDNAEAAEGKADVSVPVPQFAAPAAGGHAGNGAAATQSPARWEDGVLLT
jgi:hypothetical protein